MPSHPNTDKETKKALLEAQRAEKSRQIAQDKVSQKGRNSHETYTENEREKLHQQIGRRNQVHQDLKTDYNTAYHPDAVKQIEGTLKARKGALLSETSHFTSDRGRAQFNDEEHSTAHDNVLRDIKKRGVSEGPSQADSFEHKQAIKQHALLRENLQAIELMNDFTKYLKSLRVKPAHSHEATQLKKLVTDLVSHTKDFVTPHPKEPLRGKLTYADYVTLTEGALKNFKKEMKHALTRKPHSIVEKVNDVIRKFLHIFDVLFSKVTGKPTSAETKTFGAKTLTGTDHFFNKPDSLFGKKVEAFHEAIKKAETPKNGAPKFHG